MSSGINWKYRISGPAEAPPIRYYVGIAYASGEPDELTVGLVTGLDSVRTAYANLPGLGGARDLWLHSPMAGARTIAEAGAHRILARRAADGRGPVPCGGHALETVTEYTRAAEVPYAAEIRKAAGLNGDELFSEVWPSLAQAAHDWPLERWGVAPTVAVADCEVSKGYGAERAVVVGAERTAVLAAASAWASVNVAPARRKADRELAGLLP